ncbi:hypothetical protein TrVE_jg3483 [Triparma verrucosa]|uniref:Uncharacterized protein n=1 Tax=Triparma verrucosa TaxID=1606542 RepID=A0A9W7BFH8_9STRA|nr:hypothetical protein TrVE_jg3483 [Triparma verrucosa]
MASSSSYSPDAYTTTTIGSLVQALSFRFVGTNEIPYQEEEIPEYLVGVASASIITTGVFILWGLFLLIWQCCLCTPPCFNITGLKNLDNVWHVTHKLNILRYTFFTASCLAIASLAMIVMHGVFPLLDSIKDYNDTTDSTVLAITNIESSIQSLLDSLNVFLSNLTDLDLQAQTCESEVQQSTSVTTTSGWTFPAGIDSAVSEVTSTLSLVTDLDTSVLEVAEIKATLNDSADYLENLNLYLWIFFGLTIFMGIVVFFFTTGVIKALVDNVSTSYNSLLSKVLLPLLNVLLVIFIVLNIVFSAAGISSSDICSKDGGPNAVLTNFIRGLGVSSNWDATELDLTNVNSVVSVVNYYTECDGEGFFEGDITPSVDLVDDAQDNLLQVQTDLDSHLQEEDITIEACTDTVDVLGTVRGSGDGVKESIFDIFDTISCSVFTPIYTALVHDTVCYGVADSFAWLWLSSLVFCFSVLLMNTTRRAYFDDITTDETFGDLDMVGSTMSAKEGATVEKKETLNDANSESDTVSVTTEFTNLEEENDPFRRSKASFSATTNQSDIETNGQTWMKGGQRGGIGSDISTLDDETNLSLPVGRYDDASTVQTRDAPTLGSLPERPHSSQMWTESQPNTARNVRRSMDYPSVDYAESENVESNDQSRSTVSSNTHTDSDSDDSEEERILEEVRRRKERKEDRRRHDRRRGERSKSRSGR